MATISANLTAPPPPQPRHRMSEGGVGLEPIGGRATTNAASSGTGASGTSSTGTSADADSLDPSSLTDRIGDLLAQQVGSGTLTQAQADTLKSAFDTIGGGTDGVGARSRPQGPPPAPPPTGSEPGSDAADAPAENAGASSAEDLLASFLTQLQTAQNQSGAYAADGTRSSRQNTGTLLLDFTA